MPRVRCEREKLGTVGDVTRPEFVLGGGSDKIDPPRPVPKQPLEPVKALKRFT